MANVRLILLLGASVTVSVVTLASAVPLQQSGPHRQLAITPYRQLPVSINREESPKSVYGFQTAPPTDPPAKKAHGEDNHLKFEPIRTAELPVARLGLAAESSDDEYAVAPDVDPYTMQEPEANQGAPETQPEFSNETGYGSTAPKPEPIVEAETRQSSVTAFLPRGSIAETESIKNTESRLGETVDSDSIPVSVEPVVDIPVILQKRKQETATANSGAEPFSLIQPLPPLNEESVNAPPVGKQPAANKSAETEPSGGLSLEALPSMNDETAPIVIAPLPSLPEQAQPVESQLQQESMSFAPLVEQEGLSLPGVALPERTRLNESPDRPTTPGHNELVPMNSDLSLSPPPQPGEAVEAYLPVQPPASRRHGGSHPALIDLANRLETWTGTLIRIGQGVGAVRSDLPSDLLLHAGFAMLEGMDRWLATHWDEMTPDRVEETAHMLVALIRRMAEPEPRTSEPAGAGDSDDSPEASQIKRKDNHHA